jgi:hypothetical protein
VLEELNKYPSEKTTFMKAEIADPEKRREMQRIAGNLVRTRLERIIEMDGFKRMNPDQQRTIIQNEINRSKDQAEAIFARNNKDLLMDARKRKQRR